MRLEALWLQKYYCVLQFSICVGITIVVGLTLGILGYVYGDWFSLEFAKLVNRTIKFYREDNDLQNIIDFTQSYVSDFSLISFSFARF